MKNNILKVFAVLLAVMMLFALASCGGEDKDKDSSETTGTSSVTETEKEETRLTASVDKYEAGVEPRLLTAFNRIRNNMRNGLAVVKIERDACGGDAALLDRGEISEPDGVRLYG